MSIIPSIKSFNNIFNGHHVTIIKSGDNIYFKAKDIAIALGYSKTKEAVIRNVDVEDKLPFSAISKSGLLEWPTLSEDDKTIFINESGMYSLVLRSNLPSARAFKHWVTSEVLPQIRKTGKYEDDMQAQLEDCIRASKLLCDSVKCQLRMDDLIKGRLLAIQNGTTEYFTISERASLHHHVPDSSINYGGLGRKMKKLYLDGYHKPPFMRKGFFESRLIDICMYSLQEWEHWGDEVLNDWLVKYYTNDLMKQENEAPLL